MRQPRERGFVMVVLLIAMAVTAVWMTALLPKWTTQATREKEENLVFYGRDYAKSIARYYLKNNCTLPADVDQLLSGHYLRRKWKDPITGKDFLPQMVGGAASSSGLGQGSMQMGPRGNTGTSPAQQQTPQGPAGGNRGGGTQLGPAGQGGPVGGAVPGGGPVQQGGGQAPLVGLAGVMSESTATSIKLINNTQQYNLWRFDYNTGCQLMGRGNCPSCQNGQPVNNQGQPGGRQQGDGRSAPAGTQIGQPGNRSGQGPGPLGAGGPPPPGANPGRGRG